VTKGRSISPHRVQGQQSAALRTHIGRSKTSIVAAKSRLTDPKIAATRRKTKTEAFFSSLLDPATLPFQNARNYPIGTGKLFHGCVSLGYALTLLRPVTAVSFAPRRSRQLRRDRRIEPPCWIGLGEQLRLRTDGLGLSASVCSMSILARSMAESAVPWPARPCREQEVHVAAAYASVNAFALARARARSPRRWS